VDVAARTPASVEQVDIDSLVYDPERQLTLTRDGAELVPWCKHTDGPTSSNANTDGAKGPEYDTDHRED
jgi:putative ATP-grasp target RiPP